MTAPAPAVAGPNGVGAALGLLGDEWTLLLVRYALAGVRRYGVWREHLGISDAVLSARLATLVDAGVLTRERYGRQPERFEYRLTESGRDLWTLLVCIWWWERHHVAGQSARLPVMRHRSCGHVFDPRLSCVACGRPAAAADVEVALGPSGDPGRSAPVGANRRRASTREAGGPGLFPETMALIGNRWSSALLGAAFLGVGRFGELQRLLGIPPSTLAARLRSFVDLGVFEHDGATYRLTAKGEAFFPAVASLVAWGERWAPAPDGAAVLARHHRCGRAFVPALRCSACGEVVVRTSVLVEPADVAGVT